LTVLRTKRLSEHFIRVYLGGPGFAAFQPGDFTDSYVKLVFPTADGETVRSYTVRAADAEAGELVIDFVHHGDEGIAGPWAAAARPGDVIDLLGPGGAYAPRPDADAHLLAGDESALPAIAVALEALPVDAGGAAFVEVAGPADELELVHPAGVTLTWVHRGTDLPGRRLAAAVRAAAWPDGAVHVFVHGEAESVMKNLRPYLLKERAVPAEWASISGYWRYGQVDEDFRKWKRALAQAEERAV
jgi:NADPH-dependent ferric siderophore reductase